MRDQLFDILSTPLRIAIIAVTCTFPLISKAQKSYPELERFIEKDQHDTTRVIGYVELAKKYRGSAPEKALFYMDQAEVLIEKKLSEGTAHQDFYLNRLTMVYNVSGVIYRNFENYPQALHRYEKALKLLEKVDNKKVKSSTLFNIGKLNGYMGNPKEALRYYNRSLAIRKQIRDSVGMVNCYREMGKLEFDFGNTAASISQFHASLKLANKIPDTMRAIKSYAEMSEAYLEIGKDVAARDSLLSALRFYENSSNYAEHYHRLTIPLAKAFFKEGNTKQGLDLIQKSIVVAKNNNFLDPLPKLYSTMADGYAILGDFKNAHRFRQLQVEADSIIQKNNNTAEIIRIEMNYLFGKKRMADSLQRRDEQEISRLKMERQKVVIERGRITTIGLIVVILLLAVIGFFIYRNYRLKRAALEDKEKDVQKLSLKIKRESEWIDNLVALNDRIKKGQAKDTSMEIQQLVNSMRDNLVVDKHRQVQAQNIDVVTNEFREKLRSRYPELTKTEIEMCELIRLELSNSEISRVRNISQNSARMARYRLKKKLNLREDQSIYDVLKEI